MPHETLIVARNGPVLEVAMNRPEARNALSQTMVRELIEVFLEAREEASVRVVVLTGAGGTFCAGGDLKGMQEREAAGEASQEKVAASNRLFGSLLQAMDDLPKALIALVEGAAMGGAVGLIAVADWVIADKSAQIGAPEVTVGVIPAQIAPFVQERVGSGQARRLAAFGQRLAAEEAARIGLVHELADGRADLRLKGAAAVNQCLRCAPGAVAETKRLLRLSLRTSTEVALDQGAAAFAAALSGEAKEGIRAFIDKRKPTWLAKIEKL
jgi:isohexenylglutaconyl-CoA hydratase